MNELAVIFTTRSQSEADVVRGLLERRPLLDENRRLGARLRRRLRHPVGLLAQQLDERAGGGAAHDQAHGQRLRSRRRPGRALDLADEQARGLMFRDEMAADRGMIFIHDSEQPQAYWMKNTHIPLDIFYFDHARKLVSVQQRVPPCSAGDNCPPFASDGPALYVLELNAGLAEQLGVKAGDELLFGPQIGKQK